MRGIGDNQEKKNSEAEGDDFLSLADSIRLSLVASQGSVFGPDTSQEEVYSGLKMDELVAKVAEGYHATVFAYGQTGTLT